MSEIRALIVGEKRDSDYEPDSWVTRLGDPDEVAYSLARLLSRIPEYDWTEVWENGERVKVYVRGHCVLSA